MSAPLDNNAAARLLTAWSLYDRGELDAAIDTATNIGPDPNDKNLYLNRCAALGWFLIEKGDLFAAESVLWPTLNSAPEHAVLQWYTGHLRFKQGNLTQAVSHLSIALTVDPSIAEAATTLAWILHDQGKLIEATIWARHALKEGINPERQALLAWLMLLQDRAADAIHLFRQSLSSAPQALDTYIHLARALSQEHRNSEALAVYEEGLKRFPEAQPLLLAMGWLYREMDEIAKAHALAQCVIKIHPGCANAWLLLGVTDQQGATDDNSVAHLTRALELDSTVCAAAIELANRLRKQQRFQEAASVIASSLQSNPDNASLCELEAQLSLDLGENNKARRQIHKLLARQPKSGSLWYLLAQSMRQRRHRTGTSLAVRRALRYTPNNAGAWCLEAWLAQEDGRLLDARWALEQFLRLAPASVETDIQAAHILSACGDLSLACVHAETAVVRQTTAAKAWHALGHVQQQQGRLREAEYSVRHALALDPEAGATCFQQLGWILRRSARFEEACAAFRQACDRSSADVNCLYELAESQWLAGWTRPALVSVAQILRIKPTWPKALLLHARLLRDCDAAHWEQAVNLCANLLRSRDFVAEATSELLNIAAQGDAKARQTLLMLTRAERLKGYQLNLEIAQAKGSHATLCAMTSLAYRDFPDDCLVATAALCAAGLKSTTRAKELRQLARSWHRRQSTQAGTNTPRALEYIGAVKPATDRLRIGYVASHFHRSLLTPILAAHSQLHVDIFLYCDISPDSLGSLAQKISLQPLRGQDLARSMRANQIDIAIDTVGVGPYLGQDNVLMQFSRRVAPVQCAWLGSWASSGGLFDCLLTDMQAVPADHDQLYEEAIVRMPDGQWCWEPPAYSPPVAPPPCLMRGSITLGCAVRAFRISPRTLQTWCDALTRLPNAQLILIGEHGQNSAFRADLATALSLAGVDPCRIAFTAQRTYQDYLSWYEKIDIALDSFPANGGLCLIDALWMGVPFVTLTGNWAGERQGLSILSSVGHAEWAANSEEDYVKLICRLAADTSALATLRQSLRNVIATSPITDGQAIARSIEAACASMKQQARAVAQAISIKERVRAVAQRQLEVWFDKQCRLVFARSDDSQATAFDVSVIVVLFNQAGLARQALSGLADQAGVSFETIIVDNASDQDTQRLLDSLNGARIVRNSKNVGFLRAANQGAALARGRYVLFLNSDAIVHDGALLQAMRRLDSDQTVGAVGGRIVLADGTLQEAGCIAFSTGSTAGYGRGRDPRSSEFCFVRDVDFVSGAFLMVRYELWTQLGGFDPIFAPAYYEDADLCLRIQDAGYRVVYDPSIWLTHFEWASSASSQDAIALMEGRRTLFRDRHHVRLSGRPSPRPAALRSNPWLTRRKTRILIIDNAIPHMAAGGGLPRARMMMHALASNDVTLFPLWATDDDWRDVYTSIPDTIEVMLGAGPAGLEGFLRERIGTYDYLMVSRPPNMAFVESLKIQCPELFHGMQIIYDAEAVFALREIGQAAILGKPMSMEQSQKLLRDELALARHADTVLTVSNSEAQAFRAAGSGNVHILAHAMATRTDAPDWHQRANLLFIGAIHPNTPNEDGLLWFCKEIMPILKERHAMVLSFNIVGDCSSDKVAALADENIHLIGRVDSLVPYYDQHRVFVAPTRFAAGVPLKVIEAGCNGIPVVATSLLVRQLGWQSGREVLLADGADTFADAVAALYNNEALWTEIQNGMQSRTVEEYSPDRFLKTLTEVFNQQSGCTEQSS